MGLENSPAPPPSPDLRRVSVRFSPVMPRPRSHDRISDLDGSYNNICTLSSAKAVYTDPKSPLLPKHVGVIDARRQRTRSFLWWCARNAANLQLGVVLITLSLFFGAITWKNHESKLVNAVSFGDFALGGGGAESMPKRALRQEDLLRDNGSEHLAIGRNGVISSDIDVCSEIGIKAMREGGNAIDAALAAGACIGSINMFASGVGGGGFMVVRMADGRSKSFNSREMAPAAASRDMYNKDANLAQVGGLAVAVPGEVHGYAAAHKMFGALPWKSVWEPSINLNTIGFKVTPTLRKHMLKEELFFIENKNDWGFLFSNLTDRLALTDDIITRHAYAKTLAVIAGDGDPQDPYAGVREFYNGTIASSLTSVIQAAGGIMTENDFSDYHTIISDTVNTTFMGNEIITCPPPCSGQVMLEGLNIAEGLPMNDPRDGVSFHYLIEAMKWLSAGRTELGDPTDPIVANNSARIAELLTKEYAETVRAGISANKTYGWEHYKPSYEPNHPHGTSHLSVIDKDGNAVSLTTTINLYWGAKVHDPVSGIVLNSEMDDFSIPERPNSYLLRPSVYNYIKPSKRPLSSTAPTIVVGPHGEAKIVIGGSGGSRIVTSVFQALIKKLSWGYSLLDTIHSPRLHHQLIPEVVTAEHEIENWILVELMRRGHRITRKKLGEASGGSVLQGVYRDAETGILEGVADWWRKGGEAKAY